MFSFHHLTMSVRHLAVSEAFYKGLGFACVHRWQDKGGLLQICHLQLGQALLELYCFKREDEASSVFPPGASGARLGLRHFALQVSDIDDALSALHGAGLITDKPSVVLGQRCERYVFIMDPDGNSIELLEGPLVQIQRPDPS